MSKDFKNLSELKKKLGQIIRGRELFDKKLKDQFWVEFIYGSSVVEGVKLNKAEVENIVREGNRSKFLKNKPNNDLLQAYGQKLVLEQIEKWAKQKKLIDTQKLLLIHHLIFQEVDSTAGRYRDNYIKLRSSALMPSLPFAISADIRDFNNWLTTKQKELNQNNIEEVIEFIAQIYHTITRIHPFSDGNGRSARLFTNLFLRRFNLPYILVPKVENVGDMRQVLRMADMGNIKPLIEFQAKLLEQSLLKVINYWQHYPSAVLAST